MVLIFLISILREYSVANSGVPVPYLYKINIFLIPLINEETGWLILIQAKRFSLHTSYGWFKDTMCQTDST